MEAAATKTAEFQALIFKGREFILVGDETTGAIYDREVFENFGPCAFRLFPDGTIRSSCEIVGTKQDIKWI